MKLYLMIETPDDDNPHYPRTNQALTEYVAKVAKNNKDTIMKPYVRESDIGCTYGPDGSNTFTASNGVSVKESRRSIE